MQRSKLRVACLQTGSVNEGDDAGHGIERAKRLIDDAHHAGAQIVVFPELFLAPFFPKQLRADIDQFFFDLDDRRLQDLRGHCRARNLSAIIPIAEKRNGSYYNSAVFVDETGEVGGVYRKTHIPAYLPNDQPGGTGSYEKFYFTPGESLPVFRWQGTTFGIQICNDRLYPEASRILAMKGAEVIFMPISYSSYSRPEERASIWEVPLRARAFENGIFVVAANRVGTEGDRRHIGRSMIVGPNGMILAEASGEQEQILVSDLDLSECTTARLNFPWWRDRRPGLYQALSTLE
jgi:predicted amidohydrolase